MNFDKAINFQQTALAIFQKIFGESNEKTRKCREMLDMLKFSKESSLPKMGILPTAIYNYKAFSSLLKCEISDDSNHMLNTISLLHKTQGNLQKALLAAKKSFNISCFINPMYSNQKITALILANIFEDLNLPEKAVKYYEIGLKEMVNACLFYTNIQTYGINNKPCDNCKGMLRFTSQMQNVIRGKLLYICQNCNGLHLSTAGGFYCKDCENKLCFECANNESVLCKNCRGKLFWTHECKEQMKQINLDISQNKILLWDLWSRSTELFRVFPLSELSTICYLFNLQIFISHGI